MRSDESKVKDIKKRRYIVANIIQTNYPLDGVYKFDKYVLYSCFPLKVDYESEHKLYPSFSKSEDFPLSNFVITVDIDITDKHPMRLAKEGYKLMGLSDEKANFISEYEYRMSTDTKYRSKFVTEMGLPEGFKSLYEAMDPWKKVARHFGGLQIDKFVAWLSCLTRSWMVVCCEAAGRQIRTIQYVATDEEFNKEGLEKLEKDVYVNINKTKEGEFVNVGNRPILSSAPSKTLKLPSDFHALTSKLFSLEKDKKEKFLSACFAYQSALDNLAIYPTLSVIALVSAVSALKPPDVKSYRKWFKSFLKDTFDDYPSLSDFQKKLLENKNLDKIYAWRSKFAHEFILGTKTYERALFRAVLSDVVKKSFESLDFGVQLDELEKLVNASLLQWLVEH